MPKGIKRTQAQRQARHQAKYGTKKVPKRRHKNWK